MTRQAAIDLIGFRLGVKPVGNMVWFLDKEEPPRQLTKVERKLFEYIINEIK